MRGEIAVRTIAWAAFAILAVVAAVVASVFGLLRLWNTSPDADRLRVPYAVLAPGPVVQGAPQQDLQAYRQEKQHALDSAGWVDAQRGIARIPVTDAMAALVQRTGAAVPLDAPVSDHTGATAHLADYFGARTPVLLVLGYYSCPQLCGLVMHSLLDGLQASGVPAAQWRIVGLSIDPRDGAAEAGLRREQDLAYARWRELASPRLDFLVAAPGDVQRIAQAVGYSAGSREGTIEHPATVVVLTPQGQVARYFNGIGLDAAELRDALQLAREGRTGTWNDRLALLCSRLDPTGGHATGTVLTALRALVLLTAVLLAALAWRQSQ